MPAFGLDPAKALSQYRHDTWSQEQGLPQNSVAAVLEGRNGYVWLGTQEGLARFDGHRFKVWDRRNTPALRSQVVGALAEDDAGVIWAGTEDGLLRLAGDEVTLLHGAEGLTNTTVRALLTRGREVWVGTLDGGLFRYRDGTFTHFGEDQGLPEAAVWALAEAPDGKVWVGTNHGMGLIEGEKIRIFTTADGLPHEKVYCVTVTPSGKVYAGTRLGVARYSEGGFHALGTASGLPEISVYALAGDHSDNLWVGTNGEGLYRLDATGRGMGFPAAEDRAPLLVRSLATDREGGLLIGTSGDGLHRLSDGPITTWSTAEGLPGDKVYTVYEDRRSDLWVGTFGQGLVRFAKGRFEQFTTADGLASNLVWSLLEDRRGALWAGTYGGGLSRRNADGRWRSFGPEDGLNNAFIRHVLEDRDANLWVGTKDGLYLYGDGRFERFGREEGLPNASIQVLLEDREEGLWVGTNGGGLSLWRSGRFTNLSREDGLASDEIYALHQDDEGALWIGTEGGGLHRLKEGQIAVINSRSGLADDLIYTILEDDLGYFWMSSNKGISRVHKDALRAVLDGRKEGVESQLFDSSDGMKSRETNGGSQPAAWKRQSGELVFPTLKGFVEVDPANLGEPPPLPPVVIEEILVDEVPLRPTANRFAVPATSERLAFLFTAPSLHRPEEIHFRFQLVGYDHDWVEAGAERKAVYTRIPPGDYEMMVSARAEGGTWGPPTRLVLNRLPRFYQTRWFLLVSICAFAVLLWGLHRLRVHHLERHRRELQREVAQALEHIKVLHGMLPICSSCKSIRDDQGYWSGLETYIQDHSEAEFSHGMCPDCALEIYPKMSLREDVRLKLQQKRRRGRN